MPSRKRKPPPNTYQFNKNHHALEIQIRCEKCPSRSEVISKVLKEYPHADPDSVPSQRHIQWSFDAWYRYKHFNFSMPFPYRNF